MLPSDTFGIVKQKLALVANSSPDIINILAQDNSSFISNDTQLGVGIEPGTLFYFVLTTRLFFSNKWNVMTMRNITYTNKSSTRYRTITNC